MHLFIYFKEDGYTAILSVHKEVQAIETPKPKIKSIKALQLEGTFKMCLNRDYATVNKKV